MGDLAKSILGSVDESTTDALLPDAAVPSRGSSLTPARAPSLAAVIRGDGDDDARIRLRSSLRGAEGVSADDYAKTMGLQRATGIPAAVVERNRDEVQHRVDVTTAERIMSEAPVLGGQLQNPDFAKLARDDTPTLSTLEKLIRAPWTITKGIAAGLTADVTAGAYGVAAVPFELLSQFVGRPLAGRLLPEDIFGKVGASLRAASSNVSRYGDRIADVPADAGIVERGVVSGLRSLGQNVPALGGALYTGNPAFAITSLSALTGGQSYVKAREKGLSPMQATAFGGTDAAIEAVTEAAPWTRLIGDLKAGTPMLKTLLHNQVREQFGEQAATVLQDFNEWAVLHPEKPFRDYLAERPSAALQTAIATLVASGGQVTIGKALESAARSTAEREAKAREALADAETLKNLTAAAAESKLRQREPESFKEFVDAAADGAPLTHVFVDAQTFAQTLEQSGIDPAAVAQQVPSVGLQLAEALATEGDLRIPVGEYAAHIAAEPFAPALLPHLRTAPEAMSAADAQVFAQAHADLNDELQRVGAEQERDLAVAESAQAVEAQIFGQLKGANRFTDDVNRAYAALVRDFYTTMAQRGGTTPEELLNRYQLQIKAQGTPTDRTLGDRLRQGVASLFARTSTAQGELAPKGSEGYTLAQVLAPVELEQSANAVPDNARGQITVPTDVTQSPTIIALLRNADLSTFLHESGHFFLEVLADMAARTDAPVDVKADMTAVLQWFGVSDLATWRGMTLDQKRPMHEQFARGFEAYTFEGQAPSVEMQSTFARFRAWLLNVYRSLKALNVEINDEVRGVFDRMLATDEQIRVAQATRRYTPLFDNAERSGMSADEWIVYEALAANATADATAALERRSLRDMQWLSNAKARKLRELQKQTEQTRSMVRADVEAAVMADPVYRARELIANGTLPESDDLELNSRQRRLLTELGLTGTKLSLPALKAIYGEGPAAPWRYLSTGEHGLAATEGVHPDVIAEIFGLSSGDELVRKLLESGDPQATIEQRTDQSMLERHGDLIDPQAVERAAEAAIHNDARARFLEREINTLHKAVGQRPVLTRAARAYAEDAVSRVKVRDLRPSQYSVAEARAAHAAEKAWKAGDTARAAEAKRAQLLQNQLYRAADRARAEAERDRAYLASFSRPGTRKAIDPEYVEQIEALLDRFELRTAVSERRAASRRSLVEWVESQRRQGLDPAIDDRLLNEANRRHYRDLTLEELRGVVDAVKQIEHLGRLKNRLLTAQDQRDFETVRDELVASVEANATTEKSLRVQRTLLGKLKDGSARMLVAHRKFASLVREMDGFKDGGPMWTYIVRTMNAAGDREATMRAEATEKLHALFKPLLAGPRVGGKGAYIPALGMSLNREERIAVALNVGNEGNRQRLLDGGQDGRQWTPSQLDAVLDTLTREEWHFVQGVWDLLEEYRPLIAAKETRIYGVEPHWITATPVQTKFGEFRGGYYPVKYDPRQSVRAEEHADAEAARQMMSAAYTSATTRRSFTKQRAEEVKGRPLLLAFDGIFQGVNEITHDLAWHEWLIDVSRLLRSQSLDHAIRTHYGPEVISAMKAAIRDIAAGDVPAQMAMESALNRVRHGATIAGLGWNLATSLMQPLGLTQSMVRIGPAWVARGIADWLGSPEKMSETVETIYAKSEMMRLRGKTMQRELNEILNRVAGEKSGARMAFEASFFYLIQKAQLVVDVPTWLGAYQKAVTAGNDDGTAVALADQAVIDSQGAGQVKDLAQVQRGGAVWKLFTNFYSFFSTTYNLAVEQGKVRTRDQIQVGRLAVDYLLLFTIPATLGALLKAALKGETDDEDKLIRKLIAENISYLLGTMVLLRELTPAVQKAAGVSEYNVGYGGPAGLRFFQEVDKLGQQIGQGEADAALLKAANNVGGVLFHYPAGQVQRTVTGAAALMDGDTTNPLAVALGAPSR